MTGHSDRKGNRIRSSAAFVAIFFSVGIGVLLFNWNRYSKLASSMEGIFEATSKNERIASFVQPTQLETDISSSQMSAAAMDKAATMQQTPQQPATSKPIIQLSTGPIFYNVFVPDTHVRRTKAIISEQLEEYRSLDPNATLLYTLIADKHASAIDRVMRSNCTLPMTCTERARLSKGNEEDTLQAVWKYCSLETTASTNEDDTLVTYIHDKGSFHASLSNEGARKRGTRCALSCRHKMKAKPRMCNICTGSFQVIPQYHGSANMWTARCSYIKRLKSPMEYPQLLQTMYDTTLNHSTKQYEEAYRCLRPIDQSPNHLGLGRFAMERWAFSHPHVRPCDVIPSDDVLAEEFITGNWTAGDLRRAPRKHPKTVGFQYYKTSFARLAGRLFEWKFLYTAEPPPKAWPWRWYRGGFEKGTPEFLESCQRVSAETNVESSSAKMQ